MVRRLTSRSSVGTLKREAKRWLKALQAEDPEALSRLERALPNVPATPTLRDVQHALAREHGYPGWIDLVGALVRRPVAATTSREDAIRALLTASERGDADAVAAILDVYPDVVNERAVLPPHDGRRGALHFAMGAPHEAVVGVLLERGVDPDLRDEGDNAAALHFAAEHGHLGIARKLIDHGVDPIGAGDLHELEIVGCAVGFDYAFHREVAEYLLTHGARHTISSAVAMEDAGAIREIVARDGRELERSMDRTNRRRRPLHLAVAKRRTGSMATLLELGADTEATDSAGLTPLDQAALTGQDEAVRLLLEAGARVGVAAAVALGRNEDLERLLAEDPDCLRPGQRWGRLIIRAAEHASGEVIDALIRGGASVHVRDDHDVAVDGTHGYTALHAAAFNDNADAARALLRHGANPADREDKYWGTPASWADYAGHADVRDLILEGAIDVFDAIRYDRPERIAEILAHDPEALERLLSEYVTGTGPPPWLGPPGRPSRTLPRTGRSRPYGSFSISVPTSVLGTPPAERPSSSPGRRNIPRYSGSWKEVCGAPDGGREPLAPTSNDGSPTSCSWPAATGGSPDPCDSSTRAMPRGFWRGSPRSRGRASTGPSYVAPRTCGALGGSRLADVRNARRSVTG